MYSDRLFKQLHVSEQVLFSQLVLEANLGGEFRSTIVGMDDVLIANGSCCPLINTPDDSVKGLYLH